VYLALGDVHAELEKLEPRDPQKHDALRIFFDGGKRKLLLPKDFLRTMAVRPQIVATLAVLLIAAVLPGKLIISILLSIPFLCEALPKATRVLGATCWQLVIKKHTLIAVPSRATWWAGTRGEASEGADVEATPQPADNSAGNNTAIVYEGEEKVLVELLETWKTHTWPKPDNISSPLQHCAWDGIGCNDQGEVTRIRLTVKDIEGTIPASIGQLPQLEQLYLYSNSIRGIHSEKCSLLSHYVENSLGILFFPGNFQKILTFQMLHQAPSRPNWDS
jgi:hypothetical protein